MKDIPQVSIVIPAYNEEKYLATALKAVSQLSTSKTFEVIVVDNNSDDRTAEIAKSFKNKVKLKVVLERKIGRGAARARGFKEAKGKIILSTDADAMVYPSWLDNMTKDIKGDIVATTSPSKLEDIVSFKARFFNYFLPATMLLYRIIFGHYWLSGFSFAVSKEAYRKSGGFDLGLQVEEDLKLGHKVAKVGKIKYIAKPIVFSGRRFRKSLTLGLLEYIKIFIDSRVLGKPPYLDNPR